MLNRLEKAQAIQAIENRIHSVTLNIIGCEKNWTT